MKRFLSLLAVVVLSLTLIPSALAVNEDVEGTIVIYTSMYPFAIELMDAAIAAEFPNLTPGNNGSFFYYKGTSALITQIYGEMGPDRDQPIGGDIFMVAEPAFSLEMKEYGYLESFEVENAEEVLRFEYDPEGYWYPVRTLNMVLVYNPEMVDTWAERGVTIPKTFYDFAFDPSLKGYICMSDPETSGTAYASICALIGKYGEEYLDGLHNNSIMREGGSSAIAKLQTGECACIMILEESILKYIDDEAKNGNTVTNLEIIYPEDGVILIPSTIMVVNDQYALNANSEAAVAVAQWLLTPDAQQLILKGYMHAVRSDMTDVPKGSIDTNRLIEMDMGVNWENAYHNREQILNLWAEKVTR